MPRASADQFARWDAVVAHTHAPLPARLERPAATSRVAALAVKAAELQGRDAGRRALRRLRESLFVFGRPADDETAILAALADVPGLDADALRAGLDAPAAHDAAQADWEETRNPLPAVLGLEEPQPHPGAAAPDGDRLRYRFPTLVVHGPAGTAVVPGWRPLEAYVDAFATAAPALPLDTSPPFTAAEALERYETLTEVDLELLTGARRPPLRAARLALRNAPVWVDPRRITMTDGPARKGEPMCDLHDHSRATTARGRPVRARHARRACARRAVRRRSRRARPRPSRPRRCGPCSRSCSPGATGCPGSSSTTCPTAAWAGASASGCSSAPPTARCASSAWSCRRAR